MIEDAETNHGPEPPDQLVVDHRHRHFSGLDCRFQVAGIEVLSSRHLQVKPGFGRGNRAVHGAKIGGYKAVEAPLFLEYFVQQELILTTVSAIHPGVGTHQRGSMALPDRSLESRKIDLA